MHSIAGVAFGLVVTLGACSSASAAESLDIDTASGNEKVVEAAREVYTSSPLHDAPWASTEFGLVGVAMAGDSAVVAFEGPPTAELGAGEVLAVVRVMRDGNEWNVQDSFLACRSEELGISFAFADEDGVAGFVVALYAEEGDEVPHGGMTVMENTRMVAWQASVKTDHPVQYIGESKTEGFCR